MKYQLLAIDVDGTLLDDEHRLSKENQKALEQVLQSGTKVVLCSGRGYWALKDFIEQLGIRNAVITQNGSQITDYTGENILHEEMISVGKLQKNSGVLRKERISSVDLSKG
ncbi:MAG: HAD family hydrolase [Coprococcus sp.]